MLIINDEQRLQAGVRICFEGTRELLIQTPPDVS